MRSEIHRVCYFVGKTKDSRQKGFKDFLDAKPYAIKNNLKVFYDKMYAAPIQVWPQD